MPITGRSSRRKKSGKFSSSIYSLSTGLIPPSTHSREQEEIEQQRQLEEEYIKQKEARKEGVRKRKPVFKAVEKSEEELKGYTKVKMTGARGGSGVKAVDSKEPTLSGGLWTDDDLAELVRLVKKYPNGTMSRWEVIAEAMHRSVHEVTFMAAKMKESGYGFRANAEPESVAETIMLEATKKTKSKGTVAPPAATATVAPKATETVWSQDQQKLLENAIVTYTKSTSGDRWQKISNAVPGKTKEECLARYKYLVEKVKVQKAAEAAEAAKADAEAQTKDDGNVTSSIEVVKDNDAGRQDVEPEIVAEEEPAQQKGGKPRNKRKLKKQQMNFSSDEDDN